MVFICALGSLQVFDEAPGPNPALPPPVQSEMSRESGHVLVYFFGWGKSDLDIGGTSAEITTLLKAWSNGDEAALDRLAERVYPELRLMARRYMRTSCPGNTLQATALVHEVYLRLVDVTQVELRERAQFFAMA